MPQPPSDKPIDDTARATDDPAIGIGPRQGSLHVPDEAAVHREEHDMPRSVHQPSGNSYGGYGGLTEPGRDAGDAGRPQRHDDSALDRDYLQWRDAQLRRFDDDYRNWRSEGNRGFNDGFEQWRGRRATGTGHQPGADNRSAAVRPAEDRPPDTDA